VIWEKRQLPVVCERAVETTGGIVQARENYTLREMIAVERERVKEAKQARRKNGDTRGLWIE
jgi:hypothetical protein